jgi:tRNA(Ile2) C34 agmatinyltransferase TiaS
MAKKEKTVTRTVTFKVRELVCPTCGKRFEAIGKQKFCSKLCSNKAAYARNAEKYRTTRREKYQTQKAESRRK